MIVANASDVNGLIDGPTTSSKRGAPVEAIRIAPVARRQVGQKVPRNRMREAIGSFEECADRLRFANEVRIGSAGVDDAARATIRRSCQKHQMKSVVVVQPKVGDEGVWPRGREFGPGGLEVRAFDRAHGSAAGSLNHAADPSVGFGYEQPHQQVDLVGMAPTPSVTRLLPRGRSLRPRRIRPGVSSKQAGGYERN